MKVCLLAIAKNEDNYIQEWIDYHLSWNFDDIFIIQDNWKAPKQTNSKVHLIDGDIPENESVDTVKQRTYYSDFIKKHNKDYDWIAIFDIDEFFWAKDCYDIHDFLNDKDNLPSIGINWRMFGDSNIAERNYYNLINCFKRSRSCCENTFKSFYNMNKLRSLLGETILNKQSIIDVHTFRDIEVDIKGKSTKLYSLQYGCDKSKISIDWNKRNENELMISKNTVYLAHFRKTYKEFVERYKNTNCVWWVKFKQEMNNDYKKMFEKICPSVFNEVENLDLVEFINHGRTQIKATY